MYLFFSKEKKTHVTFAIYQFGYVKLGERETEETKSVTKVRKDILYIYKLHRKTNTCVHIYTYFDNQILFSIPCNNGDGGTPLLAEDRQATKHDEGKVWWQQNIAEK